MRPVSFLSQTDTNKIHPPFSFLYSHKLKVSYSYVTYFIKINFKVGTRHHYLICLNVTES